MRKKQYPQDFDFNNDPRLRGLGDIMPFVGLLAGVGGLIGLLIWVIETWVL